MRGRHRRRRDESRTGNAVLLVPLLHLRVDHPRTQEMQLVVWDPRARVPDGQQLLLDDVAPPLFLEHAAGVGKSAAHRPKRGRVIVSKESALTAVHLKKVEAFVQDRAERIEGRLAAVELAGVEV